MTTLIVLDDVFKLLSLADEIKEHNHIEAATKYYEAVHLMKRHLERGLPVSQSSQDAVTQLLQEKIHHYEKVASALINNNNNNNSQSVSNNNNKKRTCNPTGNNGSTTGSTSRSTKICSNSYHKNDERLKNWTIGGTATKTTTTDSISCLTDETAIVNETARLANTKLSYALDLDEMGGNVNSAIHAYVDASDMFLLAIKSANNLTAKNGNRNSKSNIEPSVNVLKRRLLQALDRIEQLKKK